MMTGGTRTVAYTVIRTNFVSEMPHQLAMIDAPRWGSDDEWVPLMDDSLTYRHYTVRHANVAV